MLDIDRALREESVMKSLTGLQVRQFEELHKKFDAELLSRKLVAKPKRQRAVGGGRKHTLEDSTGMLFFILMYFRVYPTMAVAGFLFGAARSRVCEWVKTYQPVLEAVLGKTTDLPQRKISSVEEFIKAFPKVRKLIIDGTERPRARPKDSGKQSRYYSGKKKRHTLKNTLVVEPRRKKILILTPTIPGSVHDKKDLDDNDIVPHVPEDIPIEVDLGYKGLENEYEGILIPHKKPRKSELTEKQKRQNRKIASSRIRGEHTIGLCKRYRCISDVYRNRREGFDDAVMLTCCGLTNFYQRTKKRA
jgi:hypothetical protein